jgi:hypothetical protein
MSLEMEADGCCWGRCKTGLRLAPCRYDCVNGIEAGLPPPIPPDSGGSTEETREAAGEAWRVGAIERGLSGMLGVEECAPRVLLAKSAACARLLLAASRAESWYWQFKFLF